MKIVYRKERNGLDRCANYSPPLAGFVYVCNRHTGHGGLHWRESTDVPEVAMWDNDRSTDK